jgi:hypothetical protein
MSITCKLKLKVWIIKSYEIIKFKFFLLNFDDKRPKITENDPQLKEDLLEARHILYISL